MEKILITIGGTALGILLAAVIRHKFILNRKKGDSLMDNKRKIKELAWKLKKRFDGKYQADYVPKDNDDELVNFDNHMKTFFKENSGFFKRRSIRKITEAYKEFANVIKPKPVIDDGKNITDYTPYFEDKTEKLNTLIDSL